MHEDAAGIIWFVSWDFIVSSIVSVFCSESRTLISPRKETLRLVWFRDFGGFVSSAPGLRPKKIVSLPWRLKISRVRLITLRSSNLFSSWKFRWEIQKPHCRKQKTSSKTLFCCKTSSNKSIHHLKSQWISSSLRVSFRNTRVGEMKKQFMKILHAVVFSHSCGRNLHPNPNYRTKFITIQALPGKSRIRSIQIQSSTTARVRRTHTLLDDHLFIAVNSESDIQKVCKR